MQRNIRHYLSRCFHLLNFYVIQWLFLRLGIEFRERIQKINPVGQSLIEGTNTISVAFEYTLCQKERRLFIWVGTYPLSGYDGRKWKYTRWSFAIPLSRWKKCPDYYEQIP